MSTPTKNHKRKVQDVEKEDTPKEQDSKKAKVPETPPTRVVGTDSNGLIFAREPPTSMGEPNYFGLESPDFCHLCKGSDDDQCREVQVRFFYGWRYCTACAEQGKPKLELQAFMKKSSSFPFLGALGKDFPKILRFHDQSINNVNEGSCTPIDPGTSRRIYVDKDTKEAKMFILRESKYGRVALDNLFFHNPGLYQAIKAAPNLAIKDSRWSLCMEELPKEFQDSIEAAWASATSKKSWT